MSGKCACCQTDINCCTTNLLSQLVTGNQWNGQSYPTSGRADPIKTVPGRILTQQCRVDPIQPGPGTDPIQPLQKDRSYPSSARAALIRPMQGPVPSNLCPGGSYPTSVGPSQQVPERILSNQGKASTLSNHCKRFDHTNQCESRSYPTIKKGRILSNQYQWNLSHQHRYHGLIQSVPGPILSNQPQIRHPD